LRPNEPERGENILGGTGDVSGVAIVDYTSFISCIEGNIGKKREIFNVDGTLHQVFFSIFLK